MIRKVCRTAEDAKAAVEEIVAHGRAGGLLLSADDISERTVGFRCSGGGKTWTFPLERVKDRTFQSVFKKWLDTTEGRTGIIGTANEAAKKWLEREGKARPESCALCAVSEIMES